ncbi:MAG: hypothetical protein GF398_15110 [Chitinivibrionales bacterium]|nr:hypothetical protein [Chitinivibrionales bacterium]
MPMPPRPSGSTIDITFYFVIPQKICDVPMTHGDSLWFILGSYDHQKYDMFSIGVRSGATPAAQKNATAKDNPVSINVQRSGIAINGPVAGSYTLTLYDYAGRKLAIVKDYGMPGTGRLCGNALKSGVYIALDKRGAREKLIVR